MDYSLKGAEELIAKLKKVQGGMSSGLEAAEKAGALLVQNSAHIKCPWITHTLQRSIHSETTEKTDEKIVVQVGTNVVYAVLIEFGGSQKAPQGYLRPAADENKDKIPKEIQSALWDIIKKVA